MQGKQVYEYAFIRFVPRVEREEFLNVGVILFSKQKNFLDVIYQIDKNRLQIFHDDIDFDVLSDYLNTWKLICEGNPQGGEIAMLDQANRFRWLTATRSTIIQSSQVHPGMCDNPEEVLKDLFENYVL